MVIPVRMAFWGFTRGGTRATARETAPSQFRGAVWLRCLWPKMYFRWPASVLGGHIYANDDCRDDYVCTYLASQHLSRAESRPAPHQLMPCERGVILKTQPPPQPRAQEAPKPRFSSGFIGIWANFDHLPVWSVGWMRNCRPQFIHVGAIQSAGPRNFTLESTDPIQPDLLCGFVVVQERFVLIVWPIHHHSSFLVLKCPMLTHTVGIG